MNYLFTHVSNSVFRYCCVSFIYFYIYRVLFAFSLHIPPPQLWVTRWLQALEDWKVWEHWQDWRENGACRKGCWGVFGVSLEVFWGFVKLGRASQASMRDPGDNLGLYWEALGQLLGIVGRMFGFLVRLFAMCHEFLWNCGPKLCWTQDVAVNWELSEKD